MVLNVTPATSPTDYNRFYNQAYDYIYSSGSGCVQVPPPAGFRQDFWQCQGVACASGGGTPGGCNHPKDGGCCCSPIIIDVGGSGFELTNAAGGVSFDMTNRGYPIQIGWTAAGAKNAFLCLPDLSGKCDDGRDLFGNWTPQPPSANPNGFAALAVYDQPANGGNGDGIINSSDAIFSSLRLWIDANHDGISQPEELFTLPSLGVYSISLSYQPSERTDQYGNVFRYRSKVNPNDPDASHVGKTAYDVFFVSDIPAGSACRVPAALPVQVRAPTGKR
jgi:hypothetical protein